MKTIAEYDQEILQNPNDPKLYNSRGNEYANIEDDDNAIADFTKAIQLDPNWMAPYYNRGMAYYNKVDIDNAIVDLTKATQLSPSNAEVFYLRGFVYLTGKKDFENAISDFDQAIKLNQNYVLAYHKRGIAYTQIKDYNKAITDFDQVIRLEPNNAKAYKDRGDAYDNIKNYAKAIEDFNKAIEINPNYAEAYNSRGMTYSSLSSLKDEEIQVNVTINNETALQFGLNEEHLKDKTILCEVKAITDCETSLRLGLNEMFVQNTKEFIISSKERLKALMELIDRRPNVIKAIEGLKEIVDTLTNKEQDNFIIPERFTDDKLKTLHDSIVESHNKCLNEMKKISSELNYNSQNIKDYANNHLQHLQGDYIFSRDPHIQMMRSKESNLFKEYSEKKDLLNKYQKDLDEIKEMFSLPPIERVEKQYQKLINETNNISTEEQYVNLKMQFLEIENYKDAKKFAQEMDEKCNNLKKQREEKKRREQLEREEQKEKELNEQYDKLVREKKRAFSSKLYKYLADKFREMNGYKDTIELAIECDKLHDKMEKHEKKYSNIATICILCASGLWLANCYFFSLNDASWDQSLLILFVPFSVLLVVFAVIIKIDLSIRFIGIGLIYFIAALFVAINKDIFNSFGGIVVNVFSCLIATLSAITIGNMFIRNRTNLTSTSVIGVLFQLTIVAISLYLYSLFKYESSENLPENLLYLAPVFDYITNSSFRLIAFPVGIPSLLIGIISLFFQRDGSSIISLLFFVFLILSCTISILIIDFSFTVLIFGTIFFILSAIPGCIFSFISIGIASKKN